MKHLFIFDEYAFRDREWRIDALVDSIEGYFMAHENTNFSIEISRYRRNAFELIQNLVEKAEEGEIMRVYAIGGEEILFDCLNGIVGLSNVQLAAIPYGGGK